VTAAPGVSMSLSGVPELLEAFKALGHVGTRQALTGALKKGAEVVAERARRYAPRGKEFASKRPLHTTIIVRTTLSASQKRKRGARRAEAEVFVGSSAPHAHLVEFGHALVKARDEGEVGLRGRRGAKKLVPVKTKRVIGHVPAYPFIRPAYDATKVQATKVVFEELGNELKKVARRYRRQAERGKLSRGAREAFKLDLGL